MPTKEEIDAAAKVMGITGTLTPTIRCQIAEMILTQRETAVLERAYPPPAKA